MLDIEHFKEKSHKPVQQKQFSCQSFLDKMVIQLFISFIQQVEKYLIIQINLRHSHQIKRLQIDTIKYQISYKLETFSFLHIEIDNNGQISHTLSIANDWILLTKAI